MYAIGTKVRFSTKYGTDGEGVVTGHRLGQGRLKLTVIKPTTLTRKGELDGWPLKKGGHYCRISQRGLAGGELRGKVEP